MTSRRLPVALLVLALAASSLAPLASAATETRRAWFHAASSATPDHWISFEQEDPAADLELYEDRYFLDIFPAAGPIWGDEFLLVPAVEETVTLDDAQTITGVINLCSDVLAHYGITVRLVVNGTTTALGDVSGVGPGTGCTGEVPFEATIHNATIPKGARVTLNLEGNARAVTCNPAPDCQPAPRANAADLMKLAVSLHDTPSYVDLPVVLPEDDGGAGGTDGDAGGNGDGGSGDGDGGDGGDGPPGNDSGSGDGGDGGDDSAGPTDGGDGDDAGGAGGEATPGFGALAALAAAGVVALLGRRRRREG